jgi:hypothetical protein
MEISTFELLAKPIAPVAGNLSPVGRRIVQGYFLNISNLEEFEVEYRILFTISTPGQNDPNRIITLGANRNVILVVDVAGNNIEIPLTQNGAAVYRGFFIIPARQTASVELLPRLPQVLTPGLLEVRGFVSLFRRRKLFGNLPPVKVLLNPEIRGTFLPKGFPPPPNAPLPPDTEFDFDQINYSLAIASGKALNEIPPGPVEPEFIPANLVSPIFQPLLEELNNGTLDFASLEAENPEKAKMLVQLLADLAASEVNLSELNTVMERLDIPVRMSSS